MAPRPVPASLQSAAPRRWAGTDPFAVEAPMAAPSSEGGTLDAPTPDHDAGRGAAGADRAGDHRPEPDADVEVPMPATTVRRRAAGDDPVDDDRNDANHEQSVGRPLLIVPVDRARAPRPAPRSHRTDDDDPAERIEPPDHLSGPWPRRPEEADGDLRNSTGSIVRLQAASRPILTRPDHVAWTSTGGDLRPAPPATEAPVHAVRSVSDATPTTTDAAGRGVQPMIVAPRAPARPSTPAPARIVIGRISVVVANAAPPPSAPLRLPTTRPQRRTRTETAHGGASGSASRFTHRYGIGQL
jgi:hypothetical protein